MSPTVTPTARDSAPQGAGKELGRCCVGPGLAGQLAGTGTVGTMGTMGMAAPLPSTKRLGEPGPSSAPGQMCLLGAVH